MRQPISFFISEPPEWSGVSIEQIRTFVELMRFAVREDKGAEV